MHAEGAAIALRQHREIAACLRRFHYAEGVCLAGHREVGSVVAGDLQEHAAIRPALVSLASRVQEPRPESKTRGDALLIAHRGANALERLFMRLGHFDIAEQGEIIARAKTVQIHAQVAPLLLIPPPLCAQPARILLLCLYL